MVRGVRCGLRDLSNTWANKGRIVKSKKYEVNVTYLSRNYFSPFLYGLKVTSSTKDFKVKPWFGGQIDYELLYVQLLVGGAQTFRCGGRGERTFARLIKLAKLKLGLPSSSMIDSVGG